MKLKCGCEITYIGKEEAKDYPKGTSFVIDKFCDEHFVQKCINCDYMSQNKEDFDEEGLCRNCEAGKLDAKRGHN